jgi:endoglucanase
MGAAQFPITESGNSHDAFQGHDRPHCIAGGNCSFILMCSAAEQLPDPTFAQAALVGDWWATPNIKADYKRGALCGSVAGGTVQPWDAILGINGLRLDKGERYRLSIIVSGDPEGPMRAMAQKGAEPWTAEGEITRRVSSDKQTASTDFEAGTTHSPAQIVFQLGGSERAWRFCLHAVSLLSGQASVAGASSAADHLPSASTRLPMSPAARNAPIWCAQGRAASGLEPCFRNRRPRCLRKNQGQWPRPLLRSRSAYHRFQRFRHAGRGYRLTVGGEISPPFSDLARRLTASCAAMRSAYFYKVRSGIDIRGEIRRQRLCPAGRSSRQTRPIAAIRRSAASTRGRLAKSTARPGAAATSSMSRVAGMTPVISANMWSMAASRQRSCSRAMNALHYSSASLRRSRIGLVSIPEAGNGVPDILDEARWELDFLVSMMVPEGEPMPGWHITRCTETAGRWARSCRIGTGRSGCCIGHRLRPHSTLPRRRPRERGCLPS